MWPWSAIRSLRSELQAAQSAASADHRLAEFRQTVINVLQDALDKERLEHAQTRRESLAKIIELKREGFVPPSNEPPAPVVHDALPKEVEDAINARAKVGTPLHGKLMRDAALRLSKDADPAVVASDILTGAKHRPFNW